MVSPSTSTLSLPVPGGEREFRFTARDFDRIRALSSQYIGVALTEAKHELVYSRLARRLRHLGLKSFEPYCTRLEEGDLQERQQFINAITTNLTSFFREGHHFEYLSTTLLAELIRTRAQSRRLRLWSAGCSTGEEPYSLAIVVREALPSMVGWDVKILATDIDSHVLATAQHGVYSEDRLNGLSPRRRQQWFRKGTGCNAGLVRVHPALQELITFRQLNILHDWPMRGPMDVIFCRNVVIYFDKPTQKVLLDRFADLLATRGLSLCWACGIVAQQRATL